MVHGAAVGTRGGGVLLVGRGGSGKSTTALRCLEAGWQYAGDDSLLLRDLGERFQACSLYSSARVDIHRLSGAFRSLRQHTEVQPGDADHKVMLLLETTHRAQIAPELPIDAVIVARVSRRGETSLRKAQAGEVLTALLPSSLFLTPGAGQKAVDGLGRLVRRVPAYVLELGSEPAHIVTAMDQVLQKHARPTRCEPSVS
jgi:hypothetical protein